MGLFSGRGFEAKWDLLATYKRAGRPRSCLNPKTSDGIAELLLCELAGALQDAPQSGAVHF